MRIALVGGGGSRTPVLYRGLVERAAALGVERLALHDVDRGRLRRVQRVLEGMDEETTLVGRGGGCVPVSVHTDLGEALDGADFVLSAVRAGGFGARALDETIALRHGVVGQETVGPGGFALALRNVGALTAVAQVMREVCPAAWLVNLSNPAGIVTQALVELLDGRAVGVCDSPIALGRGVAAALEVPLERLHLAYGGLNHLGWLTGAWLDGGDALPALLASPEAKRVEEVRLFDVETLRRESAIPNEYVYFYEHADRAVANIARAGGPRGAFLRGEQQRVAADLDAATTPSAALEVYRRSLQTRNDTYMTVEAELDRDERPDAFASAGGYHEMALSVIEAIALDRPTVLVVNTPNRGALGFLEDSDVVEVPAVVRAAGVFPLSSRVPVARTGLVEQVKAYERATLAAIERRSLSAAAAALAQHPLVPARDVAQAILADYVDNIPEVAATFGVQS